jgi:Luciferase-like monooxygenase
VDRLHLGVILPNYGNALDAERLAGVAVAAEEAGFDSGWMTDHLMVPAELAPVYGTIAEALVSLGFVAARTRRIQLGVSALIVPQRNPLVVLKQVTSLDFLSEGRIVMAVAAGWLEKEFESLGSRFDRRGRLLDDWLELARSAFTQMPGSIDHDGASRSPTAGWRPASPDPGGSNSGWLACPMPRFAGRARPGSGTRSRCRPRSSPSWPCAFASDVQTVESCCASTRCLPTSPTGRAPMSADDTPSPARRSGSPSVLPSTSTVAAMGS